MREDSHHKQLAEGLGLIVAGDREAWAIFSPDELYRYALGRVWNPYAPILVANLLNPSKATHEVIDPTLRKVCYYARRDGFGSAIIINPFALRSTDPRALKDAYLAGIDPVGIHNDAVIRHFATTALEATLVGGWGAPKWVCLRPRLEEMRAAEFWRPWHCWARTKDGHPGHPLYLKNEAPLVEL